MLADLENFTMIKVTLEREVFLLFYVITAELGNHYGFTSSAISIIQVLLVQSSVCWLLSSDLLLPGYKMATAAELHVYE